MATKIPVTGGMRVKTYEVLQRAVEQGITYGWQRAHKHTDTPSRDLIQAEIELAVLNEICEWFSFSEDKEE